MLKIWQDVYIYMYLSPPYTVAYFYFCSDFLINTLNLMVLRLFLRVSLPLWHQLIPEAKGNSSSPAVSTPPPSLSVALIMI